MKFYMLFLIGLLFIACSSKSDDNIRDQESSLFLFEDGFELVNTFNDLFPANGSRWSTFQLVNPNNNINEIEVVNTYSSEGNNSLRLFSNSSNEVLSKIDIEKSGFKAYAESKVTIEANFYFNTEELLPDLFLIDLECCSCWDPLVNTNTLGADNQCPGIRLKLSTENDYLSIERGKISGNTIEQSQLTFPKKEWVNILWEMQLSDTDNGVNSLKINGDEVIFAKGMNLPNPLIFKQVFAESNIDFSLQSPVFYERVQIGATANPTAGAIEMFVDDFSIRVDP